MKGITNPVSAAAVSELHGADGVFRSPKAEIVRTEIFGETIFFTVAARRDHIQQKFHRAGVFYEMEELEIIRKAFRPGDRFLDIGANVGNHALFVAKFLHPKEVIVVEPNPTAHRVLLSNLMLNRVEDLFDLNWIGSGIAETASDTFGMQYRMNNVGGGRMVEGKGDIPAVPVDTVVADRDVGFIKIDVEGMEVQVLRSMTETVARCKPRIFIEVDRENFEAFHHWVGEHGYRSVAQHKRYRVNENHLLVHREDTSWRL